MKSNHGRIVLLLLMLVHVAFATADYTWKVNVNEISLHEHQAVEIHYTCTFKDQGLLYTIELHPKMETETYRLEVKSQTEHIDDGIRRNDYHFILFAKKASSFVVQPEALMRKTTKESIENTVIGRDNVEDLVFVDRRLKLPPVNVDVLPTQSEYSGVFDLNLQVSAYKVNAFEPVHVTLILKGRGNLDKVPPFMLDLPGVQSFVEEPEQQFELHENGYKGQIVQKFALVADKSFTLPSFTFEYFDLNTRQKRTLKTQAALVEVTPPMPVEKILDEDLEASGPFWKWSYLFYLLTFITGFIIGKWFSFASAKEETEPQTLAAQIKSCDTMKKLLILLVLHDDRRFGTMIAEYEKSDERSLKEAKQKALEILHESGRNRTTV